MTSAGPTATPRIVVGIDGSSSSTAALRWALSEAHLVGARVEPVIAWQDTRLVDFDYGYDVMALMSTVILSARAEEGHPARVLPEAADGALMLVLGHRHHSAITTILRGSLSQRCI